MLRSPARWSRATLVRALFPVVLGLHALPAARAQRAFWVGGGPGETARLVATEDLVVTVHSELFGDSTVRVLERQSPFGAPVLRHERVLPDEDSAVLGLGPDHLLIGNPGWENGVGQRRGCLRVLRRLPSGVWQELPAMTPPIPGAVHYGSQVAVDGDRALVATATGENGVETGHVFALVRDPLTGTWTVEQELVPGYYPVTNVGSHLALSGDVAVLGDPRDTFPVSVGHGKVSVWRRQPAGNWAQEAVLQAPGAGPSFGRRVAVRGDDLVVLDRYSALSGIAPFEGRAYHYRRTAGVWTLAQVLSVSAGTCPANPMDVDLEGDLLVLSDHGRLPGTSDAARVLVLERPAPGQPYALRQELLPVHAPGVSEHFGLEVALGGGALWVADGELQTGDAAVSLFNALDGNCAPNGSFDSEWIQTFGAGDGNLDGVPDECQSIGSTTCNPGDGNNPGTDVVLRALEAPAGAGAPLEFLLTEGVPGEWGYLLSASATASLPGYGGSSGLLCLDPAADLGRFVDQAAAFGPAGSALVLVDPTAIPVGGGSVALGSGDTWHFQYWYRSGTQSYFSTALAVTFP